MPISTGDAVRRYYQDRSRVTIDNASLRTSEEEAARTYSRWLTQEHSRRVVPESPSEDVGRYRGRVVSDSDDFYVRDWTTEFAECDSWELPRTSRVCRVQKPDPDEEDTPIEVIEQTAFDKAKEEAYEFTRF